MHPSERIIELRKDFMMVLFNFLFSSMHSAWFKITKSKSTKE